MVLGLLAPLLLTDRPETASWLPDDGRRWLADTLRQEARTTTPLPAGKEFISGLEDPRFLIYASLNFGLICGV